MEAQLSEAVEVAEGTADGRLWQAVDRLIDGSPSLDDLREHRLHLLAARRWRALGRPVPAELVLEERTTAMRQLAAVPLLERIREEIEGPVLLLKGPEVAALYPDPVLRPFGDIDLLVGDPQAAQEALLASGFVEVGDPALYVEIHHLRPLGWQGLPLHVELHTAPKWLDGHTPPTFERLASRAVPAAVGVDGLEAPTRADHAVILAVHSWAHDPLRQVAELIDLIAVASGVEQEAERVALEWGVAKLWRTVSRAAEETFAGADPGWHLRTWAASIATARRRTVFETHLGGILSPFGASTPIPAMAAATRAIARDLRPAPSETWPRKLRRMRVAVRDAFEPREGHDRDLERRELL